MENLKHMAAVIKEAAKSPLGVVALIIIAVSLLAYAFFHSASETIRIVIFGLLFTGFFIFGLKLLQFSSKKTTNPQGEGDPSAGSRKPQDPPSPAAQGTKSLFLSPERTTIYTPWRDNIHQLEGIAEHGKVLAEDRLDGQVFAIELLNRPLVLEKMDDTTILTIDRTQASHGVFSNAGKTNLCRLCFEGQQHMLEFAKRVDHEAHQFLMGRSSASNVTIDIEDMPMRWSSGGVFCIVEYKDRLWTPFFFRDIDPGGWNIPLGASENQQEIRSPWNNLWREFMEEFLILNTAPDKSETLFVRKPYFSDLPDLTMSSNQALKLMEKHMALRKQYDGLRLTVSDTDFIHYQIVPTHTQIRIKHGLSTSRAENILIAVNPLELGIEAVAIVRCAMNDNDYILDGEIIESRGAAKELVRMPVALISHDYLKREFGKKDTTLQYVGNAQASIKKNDIPHEEIIIFDWDLNRRKAIPADPDQAVGTEIERYTAWQSRYGPFFDDNGLNQFNQALGLFTPTSAKIASYYFAGNAAEKV